MKKLLFFFVFVYFFPIYAQDNTEWTIYPQKKIGETPDGAEYFLSNVQAIIEDGTKIYFRSWAGSIDILQADSIWSRLDNRNTPLRSNTINRDFAVKNGKICVATSKGLLIVTNNDTLLYTIKDTVNNSALMSSDLFSTAIDDENNVWVTNFDKAYFTKYDGNSFKHYIAPSSYYYPNVSSPDFTLTIDRSNNVWYRGFRTLVKFDGIDYEFWDSTNSPLQMDKGFYTFYHNKETNQFFLSTAPTGLPPTHEGTGILWSFDINTGSWTEINLDNIPANLDSVKIDIITMDSKGNIFIGSKDVNNSTMHNKIFILSTSGQWSVLTIPVVELIGFDFMPYYSLFVDSKNFLWIGTAQNGVIKADLNKLLSVQETTEFSALPNIWIRYVEPNPIKTNSHLELFVEPSYYYNLKIKIYNYLGIEIKDITNELKYDVNTATGVVDFDLEDNKIPSGVYFLNARSGTESRTIGIIKGK